MKTVSDWADCGSDVMRLTLCSLMATACCAQLVGALYTPSNHEQLRRILAEDDYWEDIRNSRRAANGAFDLMISALASRLVHEIGGQEMTLDRLSEEQARLFRHKLKGFYAHLKFHPALMERRLFVGARKPALPTQHNLWIAKRQSSPLDVAQPVCPSHQEWQLLYSARDINDSLVEVLQPSHGSEGHQWFYTITCNTKLLRANRACPRCCHGIDHERYNSACLAQKTYVMAYVRKETEQSFDWEWIQVDASCNCAITTKFDRK